MKLGAFSLSLRVKDIHKSKEFYEKLGFKDFGGDIEQNWLIMRNEDTLVGLFQDMLESNMMTFNPGWDQNAKKVKDFTDVRKLQAELKEAGVEVDPEVEGDKGTGYFMIKDPDGNVILIDQHVE